MVQGKGTHSSATLKEGLEAENEGIMISSIVRRLARAADVKTRYNEGTIRASSVVLAILGGGRLQPPFEEWTAAPGLLIRCRGLRRGPT